MVKKITISVPDELHEKMTKWKDTFNFSRVFQDAMGDLIKEKEDFEKRLKGDSAMKEIIERLKGEKAEFETQWFNIGKKDGLQFAKSANYKTLQYALSWEPLEDMEGDITSYDPTRDEILGDYFEDRLDYYSEDGMAFESPTYGNSIPNDTFQRWESGWKEGVLAFWDEIEDKL